MATKTRNKSRAEVLADGILPCGHPAEREEDKITIDYCFECGWKTPLRAASDDLNNAAARRGQAERKVIKFVRSGEWKDDESEQRYLIQLAREARTLFVKEETQRVIVNQLAEENDYPF